MTKVIDVINLSKHYGDFKAVNNISFSVEEGEIFGFLGANGAGKTTAMKVLSGLIEPTSGTGKIAGFDIYKEREQIKRSIGYMSQRFSLYDDLTVYENIRFFGGIYGLSLAKINQKADDLLEKLELQNSKKTMTKALPLGWKQKLSFSIAIIHEPKIVFLDEPTSGVDPITRRQFWDLIYDAIRKGITVFVTTHYMDEAEYCNRISMMVAGEIKGLDTPKRLKEIFNASSMDDVFLKLAR